MAQGSQKKNAKNLQSEYSLEADNTPLTDPSGRNMGRNSAFTQQQPVKWAWKHNRTQM